MQAVKTAFGNAQLFAQARQNRESQSADVSKIKSQFQPGDRKKVSVLKAEVYSNLIKEMPSMKTANTRAITGTFAIITRHGRKQPDLMSETVSVKLFV